VIAFDYDDTLTQFPGGLFALANYFRAQGEKCVIVTLRHPHEVDPMFTEAGKHFDAVFCTGRKAKRQYMECKGHHVKLWIDDRPEYILHDFGAVLNFESKGVL
jgi:hypothetical protein